MRTTLAAADAASASDTRRKCDGLHALANIAEREGRLDLALALAKWADETAPFVPHPAPTRRARITKGGTR